MKILIVDDEPKIRRGLEKLISRIEQDANVYTAEDGLEALELLKTIVPDLIFVDIKMRNLNGIEFIHEAKEISHDIQFVIVSGYGTFEYAQAAINYNVISYILKPVMPAKIVEAIEKAKYNINQAHTAIKSIEELKMKYLDEVVHSKNLSLNKLEENLSKIKLKKQYFIVVAKRRIEKQNLKKEMDVMLHHICTYTCEYILTHLEDKCIMVFTCNHMSGCNRRIFDVLNQKDIFREAKASEILTDSHQLKETIDQLLHDLEEKDEKGETSFIIESVKRYILNHYHEKLNLIDIAQSVYLNPSYISDLFKKKTGENITDYILKIRIDKAKDLLANPEYKVYMIADAVGFANEKYFSKVFKEVIGMTPNQYRKERI